MNEKDQGRKNLCKVS